MNQNNLKLLELIKSNLYNPHLVDILDQYHELDIAEVIEQLTEAERNSLYKTLGAKKISEIFPYLENVSEYVEELGQEKVADVLENMDVDDAIDILEKLSEEECHQIVEQMEKDSSDDVKFIASFEDDEIGSKMTTNFIAVNKNDTIKEVMKKVISMAEENDNVSIIYALDDNECFYGSFELKDLIIARSSQDLSSIIKTNYPFLYSHDKIQDKINDLKEYSLEMIPVLDSNNKLIGVITSSDVIEAVDEALGEDYAKFAGLTDEEDINEPYFKSLKKRLPWLLLLLGLGLMISLVISRFEGVIASIPMIVFFQSIVLDMAGNVGTQSLAITIRFLNNDQIKGKDVAKMIFKEVKVGFTNGIILGLTSFIIVFGFLYAKYLFDGELITANGNIIHDITFLSSSVLIAIVVSLTLASFVGVSIPCLLKKFKIDPAVASGPLITTIDDLVAVITYYGIAMLFFLSIL